MIRIDYTYLNKACPKDFFPLPVIDQKIDSIAEYRVLSFLDLYKRYHQVLMDQNDASKITFITDWNFYAYKKMPFGLKNLGATYQRLLDKVFKPQIGRNIEVYVDDIVINSPK